MHEMHGPGRAVRVLRWAARTADSPRLRVHAKVHFAFAGLTVPVAGLVTAVAEAAAPHEGNLAAWTLLAGASIAGLLAWVRFIAVPLATRGKLPDGRNLADVLARRRMLRQQARERRQALRRWRDNPRYQGPHSHRRPHSLPPPPGEDI